MSENNRQKTVEAVTFKQSQESSSEEGNGRHNKKANSLHPNSKYTYFFKITQLSNDLILYVIHYCRRQPDFPAVLV